MPNWIRKAERGLNPTQPSTSNQEMLAGQELTQGQTRSLLTHYPVVIPESMHTSAVIQSEQVIFWNILLNIIYP